jgi:hypothetical protein
MITTVFDQVYPESELIDAFYNAHDAQKLFRELIGIKAPVLITFEDEVFKQRYPEFIVKGEKK